MKSAVDKVMWIGRATVFTVGLAVTLALMLGVATVALAAVPGDPFKLGTVNSINTVSKLVGSVVGPSLTIDNNSTATGATALDLQVEPGKPPFKVNSTTEVKGLNVDSIDSKNSSDFLQESSDRDDFLPNDTYVKSANIKGQGNNLTVFASVNCDPGDKLLGGGGFTDSPNEDVTTLSAPFLQSQGWDYQIRDINNPSSVTASALCADFPPQH